MNKKVKVVKDVLYKNLTKPKKDRVDIDLGESVSMEEFKLWREEDIKEFHSNRTDEVLIALNNIKQKEPEFYKALSESILHLNATYSDKYEAVKSIVDTKQLLYDPEKGKFLSLYQAMRYIQRFFASGDKFEKGENKKDILKAIHYLLFHTVMLNRKENVKNVDVKG